MSKEEKINKILEMTKEICYLMKDNLSESSLNKIIIETRVMLETYRELYEKESESDEEN